MVASAQTSARTGRVCARQGTLAPFGFVKEAAWSNDVQFVKLVKIAAPGALFRRWA